MSNTVNVIKMKKLLLFIVIAFGSTACDKDDPCGDLKRRWESDLIKFQGMLDKEVDTRDQALENPDLNVSQIQSIWASSNQRTGEIRSTFMEMYADYYKDCNPNAERLK